MDLGKMLEELHLEAHRFDEAIVAIEALVRGGAKRRGRPPKWQSDPSKKPGSSSDSSDRS
jgi:hypothetical protein